MQAVRACKLSSNKQVREIIANQTPNTVKFE